MPSPGMYGRLGKVPRRTKSNRTVRPPTEASQATPTSWATYDGEALTPTHNANLPSYSAGDRVFIFAAWAYATMNTPSGWTLLGTATPAEGFSASARVFYRDMTGGEGSTVTFTFGDNAKLMTAATAIPGGGSFAAPTIETAQTGNTDSPNPPSISPGAGLWNIFAGYVATGGGSGGVVLGSPPSGYTTGGAESGGGNLDPAIGVAYALVSGSPEDPGAFSISGRNGSTGTATFTVAMAGGADPELAAFDHTHTESDITDLTHTTDHGVLTGLSDDDHTQYLLAAGTRAATFLEVSGLTGATGSSPRFVGGTTTGAPASGTFQLGDYVVTEDGNIYVCTTAGSPGTWTAVGAGAATDADAIHDNVSGEIAAITEKVTPVSADLLLIEDSAASNAKKRVQIGNLPGGASALDDLSDVTITSPTTGQVVKYNGSAWVNDTDDTGSGSLPTGVAKGDLAVFNGTSWVRVGVGANSTVLTADSAESAGVKWAASGSGSLPDPIQPDTLTGLEWWLKADAITGLSDNDPVSQWDDLSGNLNHAVQATSTKQPIYKTNIVNSLPVVRFDATDDGMTGGPTISNPFTIFYVGYYNGASATRRTIQGASNNWLLGPYNGSWQWYSGAFAATLGSIGDAWIVHGVSQASSDGDHFISPVPTTAFFPDNPSAGDVLDSANRASPGAPGALVLGASGAFAEPFGGDLAEVIVYSRQLTSDEGYGVLSYLLDKYNLSA